MLNFGYNPTGRNIPVYSYQKYYYRGGPRVYIGSKIGDLEPGEQCALIDSVGGGGTRIGFYSPHGYTTSGYINDNRVLASNPFRHQHASGFGTGTCKGIRSAYVTFALRRQSKIYRKINETFYAYWDTLNPGDKIGLIINHFPACSGWHPWWLAIDTYRKDGKWHDYEGTPANHFYIETGHERGHTSFSGCNIITLANGMY